MRRLRLSKQDRSNIRKAKMEVKLGGEGLYIYENNSSGTLNLPKPSKEGYKTISRKGRFTGDNYFMFLVKTGDLRQIDIIMSPEKERELKKMEEKLILDQPNTVTNKGVVEHIVETTPVAPLHDNVEADEKKKDVLINENPLDGIVILG